MRLSVGPIGNVLSRSVVVLVILYFIVDSKPSNFNAFIQNSLP